MSTPVRVEVYGTAELMAKIGRLQNFFVSPRLRALLEDAGQAFVIRAQNDVPKQTRTLKGGLHHRVEGFGGPSPQVRVGVQGPAAAYARFVEHGTGPSVRVPRSRRAMRWAEMGGRTLQIPAGMSLPGGAGVRFARRVKHPGTPARPFFFKHLKPVGELLARGLARVLDEELRSQT